MRARTGVAIAFAASACGALPESTTGELGNIELAVQSGGQRGLGDECWLDCGINWPLLAGTVERLSIVDDDRVPPLTAASTNPGVFEVETSLHTCCHKSGGSGGCREGDHYDACLAEGGEPRWQHSFVVTAVDRGSAKLELRTTDGSLLDRFSFDVRRADRLALEVHEEDDGGWGYSAVSTLALAGRHRDIRVVAYDADDNRLLASGGITMSIADPTIAAFYGETATHEDPYVEVWPLARGSVMLEAEAFGATLRVPVTSD